MDDLEKARSQVALLFELTGIKRVLCVDDFYNINADRIIDLCIASSDNPNGLASISVISMIDFTEAIDDWSPLLRTRLADMTDDELTELHEQLTNLRTDRVENSPNKIASLLEGHDFVGISPNKWTASSKELIENGADGATLFLFDQNLGDGLEDGGMRIIQNLFSAANGQNLTLGLLSSTFSPDQEYVKWLEFSREYNVTRDRFLLISKKHETYTSSAGMIKLIVLNRFCEALKSQVGGILKTAQTTAQNNIDKIDIYDFEHMVFKTSREEGVWEPDTLIRLYGIYQRHELLRMAREDSNIVSIAAKIRTTMDVEITNKAQKSLFARKVMQLERYESREYLTKHHIPLDLGDIFIYQNKKLFILLAQPCDLMVRSDGSRAGTNEGILAYIRSEVSEVARPHYYRLDYYDHDSQNVFYIDFRRPVTVNLTVLDLCVFDVEGQGKITINSTVPTGLISSWHNRYEIVQRYFRSATAKVQKYTNKVDKDTLQLLLPCASQERIFKANFVSAESVVNYDVKRIGRLRQPNSGEALLQLAHYSTRTAFEHELDREIVASKPVVD